MAQNGPKSPQNDQFWSKNGPKMAPDKIKNGSKRGQKGVKVGQKPFKSHLNLHQIASKHSKSTQDTSRHTHLRHTLIGWNVDFDRFFRRSKFSILLKYLCNCQQEGVYLDLFWSVWPENSNRIKLVKNGGGSKWLKGPKSGQKGPKTVQRPSSNCLKTLKIHSGPFQTHPLTAHFHRLKRRFYRFFKQNKCFICEKGLIFAQFCPFFFGEF